MSMFRSVFPAHGLVVFLCVLFSVPAGGWAQQPDPRMWYRLSSELLGDGYSLESGDPDAGARMTRTGNVTGQAWRFVHFGGGYYWMVSRYCGEAYALESGEPRTRALVTLRHNVPGQLWKVIPQGGGYNRLNSLFMEGRPDEAGGPDDEEYALESNEAGRESLMTPWGPFSGQMWKLTAIEPVAPNVAIPPLDPRGDVYKTEGPTDYTFYATPTGTVRAVMIFVDFPDVPADSLATQATGDRLLGNGDAQRLFAAQSYGKLTLDVTRVDGWRRMLSPVGDYTGPDNSFSFEEHRAYVADAVALFPEVPVAEYRMVFVVATPTPKIPLSPAFNARRGEGVPTPRGEVRLGVTFGEDSYRNRYINLVHEVGHLFGLPDLYPDDDKPCAAGRPNLVEAWDLMDNIFQGNVFFGWHRHKMGWLDAERKTFLRSGEWFGTLSRLSAAYGTSMVVIPVGDDPRPAKVFVVELAEPILERDSVTSTGDGILIYSVDASIETGCLPVKVYSKDPSDLWQALYVGGDRFDDPAAPMIVEVHRKVGNGYAVRIRRR
jgi:M6 family metalloprotease-like protein